MIAFSCKKRGVCPSCCSKYMELTTVHLIDNILPKIAMRQFVLPMPKWIRYYAARNSELSGKILKIFIDAIEHQYKKNVVVSTNAKIGAITFIQRFGSSLNLHLHYHTLVMDALFYQDEEGRLTHLPVDNLGSEDCVAIAEAVRFRVIKLFHREGILSIDQVDVMRSWKNSGFSVNGDVY